MRRSPVMRLLLISLAAMLLLAPAGFGESERLSDEEVLAKYDSTITVTMVGSRTPAMEQTILKNGNDVGDNLWTKLYEEKLGVKIEYDWIAQDYSEKLRIAVATNNIPDILSVDALMLKQLTAQDMIQPLDDVFYKYASTTTAEMREQIGPNAIAAATINGKLMGVPRLGGDMDSSTFYIFIRFDWLKNLGLEAPKTMDDLLAISEAFTKKDPDGNGANDTFGIGISSELWETVDGLFQGYHAYPQTWLENENGELYFGGVAPEMKAGLETFAKLYADGQIDQEFGVKPWDKMMEDAYAGKIGLMFMPVYSALQLQPSFDADKNADWRCIPLVSCDDQPAMTVCNLMPSSFFVVKKGYEHPEVLMKMYSLSTETLYGPDSKYGEYGVVETEEGLWETWKLNPIPCSTPPNKNYDVWKKIKEAIETNDTSKLSGEYMVQYNNVVSYLNDHNDANWCWDGVFGPTGAYATFDEIYRAGLVFPNKYLGSPTPTMSEKWSSLTDLQTETFTKIIMGEIGIEAYDDFVTEWYKLGGETITNEMNEWYASLKK